MRTRKNMGSKKYEQVKNIKKQNFIKSRQPQSGGLALNQAVFFLQICRAAHLMI
jgi:hypothetical protein